MNYIFECQIFNPKAYRISFFFSSITFSGQLQSSNERYLLRAGCDFVIPQKAFIAGKSGVLESRFKSIAALRYGARSLPPLPLTREASVLNILSLSFGVVPIMHSNSFSLRSSRLFSSLCSFDILVLSSIGSTTRFALASFITGSYSVISHVNHRNSITKAISLNRDSLLSPSASSLLVTTGDILCKTLKSRLLSGGFFRAHTSL